jgi:transcriptional regulator with PAS, ATPase and Fis domain
MSKKKVLVSWIGGNDLKAQSNQETGPILSTLNRFNFDCIELLYNYKQNEIDDYINWLKTKTKATINIHNATLTSPINFSEIYIVANNQLQKLAQSNIDINILLSPGTPAMQAVWILLGKAKYPATFYQSSIEQGVETVDIPFDIAAEYLPIANSLDSKTINDLSYISIPINAAFENILTRNQKVTTIKHQAQILADKEVPVLILGETGTGKELFAKAIHQSSKRSNKPFIALNCGAIPSELVDSVLFGHKKGAFTGAITDKLGVFDQANGGILFLDEFGELDQSTQVRLLRVLQEGTFSPIGSNQEHKTDIRLIAATHRNLLALVSEGRFREDLFYRVAVGVLNLPPLREREGDILYLAEKIMEDLSQKDSALKHKLFSVKAKNLMLKHPWKGNIRELQSTILRALIWSSFDSIDEDDIKEALFYMPSNEHDLNNIEVSYGIDLQRVIDDLSSQYIKQALKETSHNKTRAAELLGFKNYQTLNNWMKKYNIN